MRAMAGGIAPSGMAGQAVLAMVLVLWLAGACAYEPKTVTPRYPVSSGIDLPAISSDAFILGYLETSHWGDKEGGKLAQVRAGDPRVKEYGRYMADQHLVLLNQTQQTETVLRLPPAFNADTLEVSTEQRQAMQALRRKTGPAFDRAYLRHEIDTHREMVARLEQAVTEAHNPEVKQLIDESKPVVQGHLDAALALDRALSRGE